MHVGTEPADLCRHLRRFLLVRRERAALPTRPSDESASTEVYARSACVRGSSHCGAARFVRESPNRAQPAPTQRRPRSLHGGSTHLRIGLRLRRLQQLVLRRRLRAQALATETPSQR